MGVKVTGFELVAWPHFSASDAQELERAYKQWCKRRGIDPAKREATRSTAAKQVKRQCVSCGRPVWRDAHRDVSMTCGLGDTTVRVPLPVQCSKCWRKGDK